MERCQSQVITVAVADDQRLVREGLLTMLRLMPEVEVVGAAADGDQAVQLVAEKGPSIVLMDLRMPRCDGVQATMRIRERYPGTRVVVLTTYADDESILAALSAGAAGYLTKDAARDDIRRALDAAVAGQTVLDSGVQAALLRAAEHGAVRPAPATLPDGLTEREAEVLTLIAAGLSNAEIAERLYVAETTVKTHINRIFAKTQSRDRAQAAAYAHRHHLAGAPDGERETPGG
jgi:DNA-binding NarL/FixJ family response regulator